MIRRDRTSPPSSRSRVPAGNSRKPVKGATRKAPAANVPRQPSAWLNRLIIIIAAGVVLVAGLQAYLALQAIPVQHIIVTGELEHTRPEVVEDLIQPALVGGFLGADLQRIRAQLEELPWIYRATVQRRWPNALEINVVEQLPIARWGESGFLNHEGGVFQSENSEDWQNLPRLQSPVGDTRALVAGYQRLVEILEPLHLSVAQLTEDERGQVEVVLNGGMVLLLGSENFLERMHRFVAIYRTELAARAAEVERVDLRYLKGIAVTFTQPAELAGVLANN